MTDAERESQIRQSSKRSLDELLLLRLLDEARAEIQKRHEVIEEQGLSMGLRKITEEQSLSMENMSRELQEKDAEIARLREARAAAIEEAAQIADGAATLADSTAPFVPSRKFAANLARDIVDCIRSLADPSPQSKGSERKRVR